MSGLLKSQTELLQKLGISRLNNMQQSAYEHISSQAEVVIHSPTGTGKTLAFLLPLLKLVDTKAEHLQLLILVPSRELGLQIEQLIRECGTGIKANCVYGGRAFSQDKLDIKHMPSILIGTPGRLAHHLRKNTISLSHLKGIVLDEFDKSLEIGFEDEMSYIMSGLNGNPKKVLTSATPISTFPSFVKLQNPITLDFLGQNNSGLTIKVVESKIADREETLIKLLRQLADKTGIVFCNFKDSIRKVSDMLNNQQIGHACFYGGMEQRDREEGLIMFRNGTYNVLLATDLAARGIDVPDLGYIIHYHLPLKEEEFIHRNGRTARMNSNGIAYVLKAEEKDLPEFITSYSEESVGDAEVKSSPKRATIHINAGRRDKISKGDIAGFLIKSGKLNADEVGLIELKPEASYVAVPLQKSDQIIQLLNRQKLKSRKVILRRVK